MARLLDGRLRQRVENQLVGRLDVLLHGITGRPGMDRHVVCRTLVLGIDAAGKQ